MAEDARSTAPGTVRHGSLDGGLPDVPRFAIARLDTDIIFVNGEGAGQGEEQMRSRVLKRLAIIFIAFFLIVGGCIAYLLTANLVWLRRPLVQKASQAIGRQLRIEGSFSLHIGTITRLTAGRIVIANAPWASAPAIARVRRAEVLLDTASLFHGPVHLVRIDLDGVEIDLEKNTRGQGNWVMGPTKPNEGAGHAPPLPHIDHLRITGLHLSYRGPAHTGPLTVELTKAIIGQDTVGRLLVSLAGTVDGHPIEVSGGGGPLANLVAGGALRGDFHARLGRITARLNGRTASLSSLAGASLDLSVRGPDIADLARLVSDPELGSGPFHLRVSARPAAGGSHIAVVASAHCAILDLAAHGTVDPGHPPSCDLTVALSGRTARALSTVAGLPTLPNAPFSCSGRIRARGFPLTLTHVGVRLGSAVLHADGTLGRPPVMSGTRLSLDLATPNGRLVSALTGITLPPGRLKLRGTVSVVPGGFEIHGLRARLGANTLAANGVVAPSATFAGSTFTFRASGPNLATLDGLARARLPQRPFALDARLTMQPDGFRVDEVRGRLGSDSIAAHGRIVTSGHFDGTSVNLSISGPDPAALAALAGFSGLPRGAFRADARISIQPGMIEIGAIRAALGSNTFAGTVTLANPPGAGPVQVALDGNGPNAAELAQLASVTSLPRLPYHASVRLALSPHAVRFDDAQLTLGREHVTIQGRLVTSAGLGGTSLDITASGDDVSRIGRIIGFPALPKVPFSLHGGLDVIPGAYRMRRLSGTIAGNRVFVDGTIGMEPAGRLDLDFDAAGQRLASLTGVLAGFGVPGIPAELPSGAYTCSGHITHGPGGAVFRTVTFSAGGLSGSLDGTLGPAPSFPGTDLHVRIRAPGTVQLPTPGNRTVRLSKFDAAAHVWLGHRLPAGAQPRLQITGRLAGRRLEVASQPGTAPASPTPKSKLVFPTEPLDLGFLRLFDGTIRCRISELILPATRVKNLAAQIRLTGATLRIDPLTAVVAHGGVLHGVLSISPAGRGYRTHLSAALTGARLDLSRSTSTPRSWSVLDARIMLTGIGRSIHGILASSNGRLSAMLHGGRIAATALETVGGSALMQVLNVINPFAKSQPSTSLECAAVGGRIANGFVTFEPLGLKTSNVTTTGRGSLDLATEKLDVVITAKPRRGLGISASSLTNSLLKVSGTLRNPVPRIRPLAGAANTGVAVATAGLSLLARGLWNRLSSSADTCTSLRRKVDALWKERTKPAPTGQ